MNTPLVPGNDFPPAAAARAATVAAVGGKVRLRLRGKVLAAGTAVMGILFALAVVALSPDLIAVRVEAERKTAAATTAVIAAWLKQTPPEKRSKLLEREIVPFLKKNDAFAAWAVTDGKGQVIARSKATPATAPETTTFKPRTFDLKHRIGNGDAAWYLYARTAADLSFGRELLSLFAVMLLGTVFLLFILYGLLVRLVVRPVERLAAAAAAGRRAAAAHTRSAGAALPLPTVPPSGRDDEVGELIRAYNEMVGELNDLRRHLEQRVNEARRELEEAHGRLAIGERLAAVGKLASGVAHEINNPLGGMLNAARDLRRRETDRHKVEYLDLILEGLERIRDIVGAMRGFVRRGGQVGDGAAAREAEETVDLAAVLAGALLFCRHRLDELNVVLRNEYQAAPSPYRVRGRGAELGQVFLNLLLNAVDALEARDAAGEKILTLSLVKETRAAGGSSGEEVILRISDNGPGLTSEEREKALELFFTTKPGGSGMGLAVAARIIKEHGGTLSLESEPGRGTTAVVRLPADPAATNDGEAA